MTMTATQPAPTSTTGEDLKLLGAARFKAGTLAPYFRTGLYFLVPTPTPGIGTMGVTEDGRLYYDPEAIRRWDVAELATVLVHELHHLLRRHAARRRAMGISDDDAAACRRWNVAADLEINDDLGSPWKLPKEGITPATFKLPTSETAEWYYRNLPESPEGGQGSESGEGSVTGGNCGSGAGGQDPEGIEKAPKPASGEGENEGDGAAGRSEAALEGMRRSVAAAVREAAKRGKAAGNVPAGLARWAEAMAEPSRIPWRTKLARLLRNSASYQNGASDFGYDKPNRRQDAHGWGRGALMIPRLRKPRVEAVVAVDTSGSMGAQEMSAALRETRAILQALGTDVRFLTCDTQTYGTTRIRSVADAVKLLKGGGGTDFRPVFREVEKMSPRPNVLVFVTDGFGPAPTTPPAWCRVIWVLTDGGRTPAEWGEVVHLDGSDGGPA